MTSPISVEPVRHLSLSLLLPGRGLAIVIQAEDKFVNPGHGQAVLEHFYGMVGMTFSMVTLIGVVQAVNVTVFAIGLLKTWSHGIVLVIHGVKTLRDGNSI